MWQLTLCHLRSMEPSSILLGSRGQVWSSNSSVSSITIIANFMERRWKNRIYIFRRTCSTSTDWLKWILRPFGMSGATVPHNWSMREPSLLQIHSGYYMRMMLSAVIWFMTTEGWNCRMGSYHGIPVGHDDIHLVNVAYRAGVHVKLHLATPMGQWQLNVKHQWHGPINSGLFKNHCHIQIRASYMITSGWPICTILQSGRLYSRTMS